MNKHKKLSEHLLYRKVLWALAVFISFWGYSQISNGADENRPFSYNILSSIKSPQTSDFVRYGNIPVNKYVGEPNLDIPLINVRSNQLGDQINVSLGYNFSGFIPTKRPDIVGLNWHLNMGGVITREIKTTADDQKGSSSANAGNNDGLIVGLRSKQNCPPFHSNTALFGLNPSTGGFSGDLNYKIKGCDITTAYDADADIFSFNFNGISGRFFLDNDNQIRVLGDHVKGFKIDISNISTQPVTNLCKPLSSEIKIIDNKGNIYYFGGETSNLEYNVNLMRDNQNNEGRAGLPVITAWHLRKIEYSNGEIINYTYRDDSILGESFCFGGPSGSANWHGTGNIVQLRKQFIIYNKLYLQDITCYINGGPFPCYGSEKSYSLTKRVILESITGDHFKINIKQSLQPYTFNYEPNDLSFFQRIQNTKVDSITLYSAQKKINQFVFNYDLLGGTVSQGSYPRLFLKSITESGKNPYIFNYDIPTGTQFPKAITKQIDHWGYYNGKAGNENLQYIIPGEQYDASGDYYFTTTIRDPDFSFSKLGILKEVIYPTKGVTKFEFEPHTYDYRLSRKKGNAYLPQIETYNGVAGGVRIKSISEEIEGNLVQKKDYLYSDGILNQWPRYTMRHNTPQGDYHPAQTATYQRSSSLIPNIMESSVMNYGKVTETQLNNGKIESYFTSYLTHPDINDFNIVLNPENTLYYSDDQELAKNYIGLFFNDISDERGKLKYENVYNNQNVLLKKDLYTYNEDPGRFNQFSTEIHLTGIAAQANKRYYYPNNLTKKETYQYYYGSGAPKESVTTEKFTYSSAPDFQLTGKQIVFPDGTVNEEEIKYSYQLPHALLISKNMISLPLEHTAMTKESINGNSKITSHIKNEYPISLPSDKTGNLLLPISASTYGIENGNPSVEINYDKYDSKGNLLQYTTKDGVSTTIIWGYNGTHPIAKIEGAKFTDIPQSLVTNIITASDNDNTPPQGVSAEQAELNLLAELGIFRTNSALSGYQITTYSYDPLIGVKSITPPSGIREVYLYDTANRLKEVREHNPSGRIIKEYQYHYKN